MARDPDIPFRTFGDDVSPKLKEMISLATEEWLKAGQDIKDPRLADLIRGLYEKEGEPNQNKAARWGGKALGAVDYGSGLMRTAAYSPLLAAGIMKPEDITNALKGPFGDQGGAPGLDPYLERAGIPTGPDTSQLFPYPENIPTAMQKGGMLNATVRGALASIPDAVLSPSSFRNLLRNLEEKSMAKKIGQMSAADVRTMVAQKLDTSKFTQDALRTSMARRLGAKVPGAAWWASDPLGITADSVSRWAAKRASKPLDLQAREKTSIATSNRANSVDPRDPTYSKIGDRIAEHNMEGSARHVSDNIESRSRELQNNIENILFMAGKENVHVSPLAATNSAVQESMGMLASPHSEYRKAAASFLDELEPHFFSDVPEGIAAKKYWEDYISKARRTPNIDTAFLDRLEKKISLLENAKGAKVPINIADTRRQEAQVLADSVGAYTTPEGARAAGLKGKLAKGYKEAIEDSLDTWQHGEGRKLKTDREELGAYIGTEGARMGKVATSGAAPRATIPGMLLQEGVVNTGLSKMGARHKGLFPATAWGALTVPRSIRDEHFEQIENQSPWRLMPSDIIPEDLKK
jgi:hypothetical protein